MFWRLLRTSAGRFTGRKLEDIPVEIFDIFDPAGEQLVNCAGPWLFVAHAEVRRLSIPCFFDDGQVGGEIGVEYGAEPNRRKAETIRPVTSVPREGRNIRERGAHGRRGLHDHGFVGSSSAFHTRSICGTSVMRHRQTAAHWPHWTHDTVSRPLRMPADDCFKAAKLREERAHGLIWLQAARSGGT